MTQRSNRLMSLAVALTFAVGVGSAAAQLSLIHI